uniref:Candidate secreted effector n=1 Tax=Meloidogyne incognita TaxID=6306 RepID=A0A914M5N7_MELIC
MRNMEKSWLQLNKKLEISEYLIFSLRLEIKLNKRKYEQEIKGIKDLAEDLEEIKILDKCNFTFSEASHEENENTKELLSKDEQLQLEIQKKEMKILSLEMEVETGCQNDPTRTERRRRIHPCRTGTTR